MPQFCAERRYLRRDGSTIWMQISAVLVRGTHDTGDMVVAQFQDVTARRKAEAELARRAVTDPLTGLSNRNELITRIEAHPRHPLTPRSGWCSWIWTGSNGSTTPTGTPSATRY